MPDLVNIPALPAANSLGDPSSLPLEFFPEFDHKMEKYYHDVLGKDWPPQIVLSLSGGKDSTAMLLKHLEEGIPVHSVFWFDTGWEFPQMYTHIDKLEKYTGVQIHRVKSPHNFDDLLKKYRWPAQGRRWCTSEKTAAAKRFMKSLPGNYNYLDTIGFARDEQGRMFQKTVYERWTFYPLADYWRMSEKDCLAYCRSHGFDWGGLYELMDRVSCFCCPLSRKRELYHVKREFPKLWERMVQMEAAIPEGKYIPYFKGKMGVKAYGEWLDYQYSMMGIMG